MLTKTQALLLQLLIDARPTRLTRDDLRHLSGRCRISVVFALDALERKLPTAEHPWALDTSHGDGRSIEQTYTVVRVVPAPPIFLPATEAYAIP